MNGNPSLPQNFFWLDGAVAGSGHPGWAPAVLHETLAALKQEGIGLIVSLAPLDGRVVADAGFGHHALDVPDMGVPDARALAVAIDRVQSALARGEKILAHCGAGYGRTGTFLACLLVTRGVAPEDAMRIVREKRPGAIETRSQEEFVRAWSARANAAAEKKKQR